MDKELFFKESAKSSPVRASREEFILDSFRDVIRLEAHALEDLANSVGTPFLTALELLTACKGKVVVTGVGKSGIIGKKIASTLCSTGTVASFLHPTDALHGDAGFVRAEDVVLAIGKSGESEELIRLLPVLRTIGAKLIAITERQESSLAKAADIVLLIPQKKEACPLNLAPTVSTTMSLAIGDALAISLMQMKDFRSEDFARYHPGGKLGKRLLLRVNDLLVPLVKCPILQSEKSNLEDVLLALGDFGLGLVLFAKEGILEGILTDGDVRRLLGQHRSDIFGLDIGSVLNKNPFTISGNLLAAEALEFMEARPKPLNVVPVVEAGKVIGVVRLHDLLCVS